MRSAEPWSLDPATPDEIASEMIAALEDLGMLKPGEKASLLHRHGCPRGAACEGGPELVWSDHDELIPQRHLVPPLRFYACN